MLWFVDYYCDMYRNSENNKLSLMLWFMLTVLSSQILWVMLTSISIANIYRNFEKEIYSDN